MDNWKRVLTGSGQTSQRKLESGSGGNQILKTWQENKNRLGWKQRPQTDAPVWDGAGSMGINNRFPLPLLTFVQSVFLHSQSA